MNIQKTITFIILFNLITGYAYSQINVAIDTSLTYQTIFGFGGSLKRYTADLYASDTNTINQIENLCFNELKINMIRVMCHPNIEPVNDNNSSTFLDTAQLNWTYYENTTKDIHAIRSALIKSNNRINYITASNNSAPAWQKANNNIVWGDTILPNMYNEFTEYLSAYLRGMKNRYNITINSISPFNEPGVATFYESLSSSRNQAKDIVINLRQRLNGLENLNILDHVDIISPDCIVVSDTSYIPPNSYFNIGDLSVKNTIYFLDSTYGGIFSDSIATNSTDIVGTHNYMDLNNTANWSKLKNVSKNKPIWVTEASTVNSPDFDAPNAVLQAKWIHRSFTEGNATAFLMHALYEPLVNGKTSGLVTWDSNNVVIPKRYYGFKQFVNFVKPGYVRINVSDNDSNLYVSGYLNPTQDTLIVVAINDTNVALSNVTFSCPASFSPIQQYATSDIPDYNTTQLANISAPTNGSFLANVEAMSITTFIIPLTQTLGVSNSLKEPVGITIFPNPTNGLLKIQSEINYQKIAISIFTILGESVLTIYNKTEIDISSLASGTYFVKIAIDDKIETHKIIKIK